MTQPSPLPPAPFPATPAPWRERTLERLAQHVRAVLPVSAVAFVTGEEGGGDPVGWFADDELRAALTACMPRLAHMRTLLLPRVDAWQAAPELADAMAAELGEEARTARVDALQAASLIACPVRSEFGSRLGVLVVASLDRRRPAREGASCRPSRRSPTSRRSRSSGPACSRPRAGAPATSSG